MNFKELEEEISLRLFITYSCRYRDKLPHELAEVGKKIVKAYNGLSLSLKVIDAFLRRKKDVEMLNTSFTKIKKKKRVR